MDAGRGHGEKETRLGERAIAALLSSGTIGRAAAAAGVSERTLRSWMHRPKFAERYRRARRQVVEHAVGLSQSIAARAIKTLLKNLTCGNPSAENAAAKIVLDHGQRGLELCDFESRLAALEVSQANGVATP